MFKVGFLITYVGPLMFVIGLTMLKEGWDDFKRHRRDKNFNEEQFDCLNHITGVFAKKQSQNLKVGDIISLEKGQRVPADLIILATSHPAGTVYLKTDQLDGETDWKVRESLKTCQAKINEGEKIGAINYTIEIPRPNNKIYEFRGKVNFNQNIAEPLRLQNTAWASTTVAAGDFFGVVAYVGKDTRIQMNGNHGRIKFPICDYEVNFISKFLFGFCVLCSLFLVALKGFKGQWVVEWIQFLVLLCCLIPQSLRTNIDIVRMIYTYRINEDPYIDGTVCRNSQVIEDLGRVDFLLSDKTGTLTQNNMIFKMITTGVMQFSEEDFEELKKMIKNLNPITGERTNKKLFDVCMMMYSLVLCNNVQPCVDHSGERYLQSSSPDEIALVGFAEKMGFFIEFRDRELLKIKEPTTGNTLNEYEILNIFPFSSARKRMGIILKAKSTGKILYFLKGADTVIKEKVDRNGDLVVEEADNLARDGLRTLAFCYKYVEQADYDKWKTRLTEVTTSINATEEQEEKVISELESNMHFIGISGVEDLLQESVRDTIESLREGGVKVWVLTGDKVETAKCIAKATGLKHKQEHFYEMMSEDISEIEKQINELSTKKDVLVIQGNVLGMIYNKGLEKAFFSTIRNLNAIMFCRCSPTQKAQITKSVQEVCEATVCSIGDGGNDVSMIQQANVGVGIEGKEGLQAAMASDFSILKFKFVKDLMFWHGRRATLSTANVTLFIIHRGLIIAMIQYSFSLFFYLITVSFYNPYLIIVYTIIYLALPAVVLVRSVSYSLGYDARRYSKSCDDLPTTLCGVSEKQAPQRLELHDALLEECLPSCYDLRADIDPLREFFPQDRYHFILVADCCRTAQHLHDGRQTQQMDRWGKPHLPAALHHLASVLQGIARSATY